MMIFIYFDFDKPLLNLGDTLLQKKTITANKKKKFNYKKESESQIQQRKRNSQ